MATTRIVVGLSAGVMASIWGVTLWLLHEDFAAVSAPAARTAGAPALQAARPATSAPSSAQTSMPGPPASALTARPRASAATTTQRLPPGASVAVDPFAESGPAQVLVVPAQARAPVGAQEIERAPPAGESN